MKDSKEDYEMEGSVVRKPNYDDDYNNDGYGEDYSQEEDTREANLSFVEKSMKSGKLRRQKLVGTEWLKVAVAAADEFKRGSVVMINAEQGSKEATGRMLDFMAGVIYANDGKLVKYGTNVFAAVPSVYDAEGGELMGADIYSDENSFGFSENDY